MFCYRNPGVDKTLLDSKNYSLERKEREPALTICDIIVVRS